MLISTRSKAVYDGIGHCFSRRVDDQSLVMIQNMLEEMNMPSADINTMLMFVAATCEKHYRNGYMAGRKIEN